MSRPYLGPSDAQANAEALARRSAPAIVEHQESIRRSWDYRARQPRNRREAVRMVRRAYQDEVPERLHDGPDAIGEGGTPRFSSPAEGYLFGQPSASDARRDPATGELEAVSWYRYPFHATLDRFLGGDEEMRRLGRIVSHVTVGDMDEIDAAIKEGAHPYDAATTADRALRAFLASLSDLRLTPGRVKDPDQEESAA